MKGQKALFSHKGDEWETPQWLFDKLDDEFHFEVDAAANGENALCRQFYGPYPQLDSLVIYWTDPTPIGNWHPTKFFLNPPYSKIAAFMKKAYEESLKGATVVCLIPARTDTRYCHDYCMKADEIRWIKGRLKFGDAKNSAPFPSMIVIFKNNKTT